MGAQLVLVHGWGFDGDVWNPLRELLGDMATRVHDLGFFGRPAAALPEPGAPVVAVGEKIHLALVRTGKDENQAIGYLPDGTMIVVNHGSPKIGTTQDVLVISTLQTAAGQMVFAELYDPEEVGG